MFYRSKALLTTEFRQAGAKIPPKLKVANLTEYKCMFYCHILIPRKMAYSWGLAHTETILAASVLVMFSGCNHVFSFEFP